MLNSRSTYCPSFLTASSIGAQKCRFCTLKLKTGKTTASAVNSYSASSKLGIQEEIIYLLKSKRKQ